MTISSKSLRNATTAVASLTLAATTVSAGRAQVAPLGSIFVSPSIIVDSPEWCLKQAHAKQAAAAASQRLSQRVLTCVDGVITEPAYLY